MTDTVSPTPRWGNEGRDRKAQAIWLTLQHLCGEKIGKGTWLDVGCGSGGIAASLAPHVDRMVGVDPEPWPAWPEIAALQENLTFQIGNFDGTKIPISESSVDIAICNQVYEHVDNPKALLRNVYCVLKPGGHCYFAGPNLLWPIEPHVVLPFVHWLPRAGAQRWLRRFGSPQADKLDAFSASYWRLTRMFKEFGFDYISAIHARLHAELSRERVSFLLRMVAAAPPSLVKALTPLAPGFVFMLTKL